MCFSNSGPLQLEKLQLQMSINKNILPFVFGSEVKCICVMAYFFLFKILLYRSNSAYSAQNFIVLQTYDIQYKSVHSDIYVTGKIQTKCRK